jgi:hypothetical protein
MFGRGIFYQVTVRNVRSCQFDVPPPRPPCMSARGRSFTGGGRKGGGLYHIRIQFSPLPPRLYCSHEGAWNSLAVRIEENYEIVRSTYLSPGLKFASKTPKNSLKPTFLTFTGSREKHLTHWGSLGPFDWSCCQHRLRVQKIVKLASRCAMARRNYDGMGSQTRTASTTSTSAGNCS